MNNRLPIYGLFLYLAALLSSCNNTSDLKAPSDSFTAGAASFVADASFAPIVDQEVTVFKALYPKAQPHIIYRTEQEALALFLNDRVRVALLAREPDEQERSLWRRHKLSPKIHGFATDALALVVHKSAPDSTITIGTILGMLQGTIKTDKIIVLDNPYSSLVRYLKTLSDNAPWTYKNVYMLKTNVDVIQYISKHPTALGIVSFSWLNEPDEDYKAATQGIKVLAVRDEQSKICPKEYFKPSQSTLALQQYPLRRSLYIIDNSGKIGLGMGFASFLLSDRGQRIVLRSGLLPHTLPSREIVVKNELKL